MEFDPAMLVTYILRCTFANFFNRYLGHGILNIQGLLNLFIEKRFLECLPKQNKTGSLWPRQRSTCKRRNNEKVCGGVCVRACTTNGIF